jgi:hypothetical protein
MAVASVTVIVGAAWKLVEVLLDWVESWALVESQSVRQRCMAAVTKASACGARPARA